MRRTWTTKGNQTSMLQFNGRTTDEDEMYTIYGSDLHRYIGYFLWINDLSIKQGSILTCLPINPYVHRIQAQ
jgi:hypothetical protein